MPRVTGESRVVGERTGESWTRVVTHFQNSECSVQQLEPRFPPFDSLGQLSNPVFLPHTPTQHTVLFRAGHTLDGEKSISIHDSQYFGETRSAPTRYSVGSHKTRTYPTHHTGCEPNVKYAFDGREKEITSYVVIQTAGH